MFKHVRYFTTITAAFAKSTKELLERRDPVEVFKDLTGSLFEARYRTWPKKAQAEVMNSAHFSGKALVIIGKVRTLITSEDFLAVLGGMESAAKKSMINNIAFATEMETVGPRQAAINYISRRMGHEVFSWETRPVQRREKDRYQDPDYEISEDAIQITDDEERHH